MMKWSRGSGELPSEKTFLVIRHDLQSSPDSEEAGKSSSSGCCETWPKMRKRRPSRKSRPPSVNENSSSSPERREVEPRPATASLEAPLILDPRLIDKLDMSLLSKELLSDSMSRISLSLSKKPTDNALHSKSYEFDTPRSFSNKSHRISNSNNNNNNNNNSSSSVTLIRPRPRLAMSARKSSIDSSATNSESDSRTSSTPIGTRSLEVKKLDDNNNKSRDKGRSLGSPLTQLSPVRSRGSRNCTINSSDVALFTSGGLHSSSSRLRKSMLPVEPCRACGRAAQPERFHSHPQSPPDSPARESSIRNKAPTRLEILQRQLPGSVNDRLTASAAVTSLIAEQPLSATSTSADEKTTRNDRESRSHSARKDRRVSSATNPNKPIEDKSATSIGKRRPRTVTCYVCGREFGSASFPIHEPKCLQKWHRENKALPSSQRRNVPQRPNVPIDHEDWNTAAWEQSQALLIPCAKCKRTFLPDRLAIHERNCRVPNKGYPTNSNYNKSQALSKSELDRMDISNLLSRRSEYYDDPNSGQMSARAKPSRIAVRMDGPSRKIA